MEATKVNENLLKEWSKDFYCSFGYNGAIGLSFAISTLFRDTVFKQLGFFPYLYLGGDLGSGKSSFLDVLMSVTSSKSKVCAPLYRTKDFYSIFSVAEKNKIIWVKEFNESNKRNNALKYYYDGVTNLQSALIFDDPKLEDERIIERGILLEFNKHEFSDNEKEAYTNLILRTELDGGLVLSEILKHKDEFDTRIYPCFRMNYKTLSKKLDSIVSERTINNYALILGTMQVFSDFVKFPIPKVVIEHWVIKDLIDDSKRAFDKLH